MQQQKHRHSLTIKIGNTKILNHANSEVSGRKTLAASQARLLEKGVPKFKGFLEIMDRICENVYRLDLLAFMPSAPYVIPVSKIKPYVLGELKTEQNTLLNPELEI